MDKDLQKAKELINSEKYREAAVMLEKLLGADRDNDEFWYIRGLLSLKLKNYGLAHECFERAIIISRKYEYFKINGMAYMEMYRFEEAIQQFERAIRLNKRDHTAYFYIALCYMFLNNPAGRSYLETAYRIDRKKTKTLIKNFYSIFFKEDLSLNERTKKSIESEINSIPG